MTETVDLSTSLTDAAEGAEPLPGVVLVWCGKLARFGVARASGEPMILGRGDALGFEIDDASASRQHARVRVEAVAGGGVRWLVEDLGSRNGTWVDGERITTEQRGRDRHVVRIGSTIVVLLPDVRVYAQGSVSVVDGNVVGPVLAAALDAVRRAATHGEPLHLTGESGAGKELAARTYHAAGPHPDGPFVAVNCATIPEGVAERLLFGAKKGAFSGATSDTEGFLQAASGGTLFLDELGELDASVQGKLLRALETREVTPLGATRPQRIDVRVCSATLHDLRARVREKRFREDLYFRIGRPHVVLPPLRERPEEVPHLLAAAIASVDPALALSPSLVEECLRRPWPGNVRELLSAAREAARKAVAEAKTSVDRACMDPVAGRALDAGPPEPAAAHVTRAEPTRDELEGALARAGGNVSAAARALGLHRTQLRRYLARHGIAPKSTDD